MQRQSKDVAPQTVPVARADFGGGHYWLFDPIVPRHAPLLIVQYQEPREIAPA